MTIRSGSGLLCIPRGLPKARPRSRRSVGLASLLILFGCSTESAEPAAHTSRLGITRLDIKQSEPVLEIAGFDDSGKLIGQLILTDGPVVLEDNQRNQG